MLACSRLLESRAKERARGRKGGGLGREKGGKEEEPVIIFLNRIAKTSFPRARLRRHAFCSFLSTLTCGKSRRQFSKTASNSVSSKPRACDTHAILTFLDSFARSFVWCVNCQNWPMRGYTGSWYTGMRCLRKWLQAPLLSRLFLSPVPLLFAPSPSPSRGSLGAWNRLLKCWNIFYSELMNKLRRCSVIEIIFFWSH